MSHRNHALVIGSGIAGLLAARILVDQFDQVTVLDRDRVPPDATQRPGIPQGNHVHVLLTQGARILEQLFPGLEAELAAAGAPRIVWTQDCPWLNWQGWNPRCPSDLATHSCSRNFLEWTIRQRLAAYKNLEFRYAYEVDELLTTADKTRVTGARLRHQKQDTSDTIETHLIVDASGRNSTLPQRLSQWGYATPPETTVNSFLGYSTRWYRRPQTLQADWQAILIAAKPPQHPRGGILCPVEGDRWVVTLVGIGRDYPPTEETAFLEFARSLRHPILYEVIREAEPLGPIYAYRRTENCWRHYEQISRFPDGIAAIGDAVCAFNPVYGQGMTTAALGALTLQQHLQDTPKQQTGWSQRFQRQLAQILHTPWMMATGEDFRWPTVEGSQPDWTTRLMHRYMDQVLELVSNDPESYRTMIAVMHMVQSPNALFRPAILLKVLRQILSRKKPAIATPMESSIPEILTESINA